MRHLLIILIVTLLLRQIYCQYDEFAEFEDFDTDDDFVQPSQPNSQKNDKTIGSKNINNDDDFAEIDDQDDDEQVLVEEEDNEFEHFQDEEEFENFLGSNIEPEIDIKLSDTKQKTVEPKLTMAKVPIHFRTHWDSYWMEILMLFGLLAYFTNYLYGKKKNSTIANLWLNTHKTLLEENFALVGDDGRKESEGSTLNFVKESESLYTLWCSGRVCCEGMLVELKMIKRQDLVSIIAGMMKPTQDQLHIKVEMSKDSMDNFVFCIAAKKIATKLFKELVDLNKFCTLVNKAEDKYNINGYSLLSEMQEVSQTLLDARLITALNKYSHLIDFIHISDQFCGPIQQQEDTQTLKQPDVKRMLICGFNMPAKVNMEDMKPLLVLVFYLMERVRRFRLSKEAKTKSEKNRLRVEEEFMKTTHAARAEAAAARREEKRKQEKERILAEDDPEKQRRWEKKEQKRQQKKSAPKMKQLSIKAL
uniref:PAT complex subunit CCDC47 n=1 Tax=Corethrella appendiculata TaxID=1370023 RepID=U5EJN1_9DIPT